jgi:hypothetical protein
MSLQHKRVQVFAQNGFFDGREHELDVPENNTICKTNGLGPI